MSPPSSMPRQVRFLREDAEELNKGDSAPGPEQPHPAAALLASSPQSPTVSNPSLPHSAPFVSTGDHLTPPSTPQNLPSQNQDTPPAWADGLLIHNHLRDASLLDWDTRSDPSKPELFPGFGSVAKQNAMMLDGVPMKDLTLENEYLAGWPISVSGQKDGVTVLDVLLSIHRNLQKIASQKDLESEKKDRRRAIRAARISRCQVKGLSDKEPLRRVDFLGESWLFNGIKPMEGARTWEVMFSKEF